MLRCCTEMARTLLPRRADGTAMYGVMSSRRKGDESKMSTHGSAASAAVATLVRLEVLSPALWRIATATLAAAMALCPVQPVGAQAPAVAFAIPDTGTLQKVND